MHKPSPTHAVVAVCDPVAHLLCCACRVFPYISEVVKWAWVQYVALLFVVIWLVDILRGFVFSQGIVSSHVVTDIPRKLE